jgi:hypothetical protein
MYKAAQEEVKDVFLRELVNLAKDSPCHIVVGGDFSMLRYPYNKSKGRIDNH